MAGNFSNEIMKSIVAQICQIIGWRCIQSTPLEVLTDVLQDCINEIARKAHAYAEQCGQTSPNLTDIGLALYDKGITFWELEEYLNNFRSVPLQKEVPAYPVPRESHLNMLKPGSHEVLIRPIHVHDHLPPMYPELEVEEFMMKNLKLDTWKKSELSSTKSSTNVFKRPNDSVPMESSHFKRARLTEEEGSPLREIRSVIMTKSGFLSSSLEGKLPEAPEARTSPYFADSRWLKNFQSSSQQESSSSDLIIPPQVKGGTRSSLESCGGHSNSTQESFSSFQTASLEVKEEDLKKSSSLDISRSSSSSGHQSYFGSSFPQASCSSYPTVCKEVKKEELKKSPSSQSQVPSASSPQPSSSCYPTGPLQFKERRKSSSDSSSSSIDEDVTNDDVSEMLESYCRQDFSEEEDEINNIVNSKEFSNLMAFMDSYKGVTSDNTTANPRVKSKNHGLNATTRGKSSKNYVEGKLPTKIDKNKVEIIKRIAKLQPKIVNSLGTVAIWQSGICDTRENVTQQNRETDNVTMESLKVLLEDNELLESSKTPEMAVFPNFPPDRDLIPSSIFPNENFPLNKPTGLVAPFSNKSTSKDSSKEEIIQQNNRYVPVRLERDSNYHESSLDGYSRFPPRRTTTKPMKRKEEQQTDESKKKRRYQEDDRCSKKQSSSCTKPKPTKYSGPSEVMNPAFVTVRTAPYFLDSDGNPVWVCPVCGMKDDGSPMIACDECNYWHHWVCVDILEEPESKEWFCKRCIAKKAKIDEKDGLNDTGGTN